MPSMSAENRRSDFISRLQKTEDRQDAAEQSQQAADAERVRQGQAPPRDDSQALAEAIGSVRHAAEQLRLAAEESRQVSAEMMRLFKAFIADLDRRLR